MCLSLAFVRERVYAAVGRFIEISNCWLLLLLSAMVKDPEICFSMNTYVHAFPVEREIQVLRGQVIQGGLCFNVETFGISGCLIIRKQFQSTYPGKASTITLS